MDCLINNSHIKLVCGRHDRRQILLRAYSCRIFIEKKKTRVKLTLVHRQRHKNNQAQVDGTPLSDLRKQITEKRSVFFHLRMRTSFQSEHAHTPFLSAHADFVCGTQPAWQWCGLGSWVALICVSSPDCRSFGCFEKAVIIAQNRLYATSFWPFNWLYG